MNIDICESQAFWLVEKLSNGKPWIVYIGMELSSIPDNNELREGRGLSYLSGEYITNHLVGRNTKTT